MAVLDAVIGPRDGGMQVSHSSGKGGSSSDGEDESGHIHAGRFRPAGCSAHRDVQAAGGRQGRAPRIQRAADSIRLPRMAKRGRMFVIAAASGTGKTTLVKALMAKQPQLRFSVSYTTRAPRPNEVDGRDYHFISKEEFQRMVSAGEFLEHAQVFDNFYGTGIKAVSDALAAGQDLLLEIDWQGAQQVRRHLPEACSIFILPPSRAALEERLRARSTDSDAVIRRRLQDSVTELSHWREFDHVVINHRFEHALAVLQDIVHGRPVASSPQAPEIAALAAGLLA